LALIFKLFYMDNIKLDTKSGVVINIDKETLSNAIIDKLLHMRYNCLEDVESNLNDALGFNVKLHKSSNDDNTNDIDESFIANITIVGYEIAYLDIYYIETKSNRFYISEINLNFDV